MKVRDLECPECGATAGQSCWFDGISGRGLAPCASLCHDSRWRLLSEVRARPQSKVAAAAGPFDYQTPLYGSILKEEYPVGLPSTVRPDRAYMVETGWLKITPTGLVGDPLETKYDGVTLRNLLVADEERRRESFFGRIFTAAQRAAIAAHWSAELRGRVTAAAERERTQVVVDLGGDL